MAQLAMHSSYETAACVDNEHLMRTIFDNILRIPGVTKTQTYISLNEAFSREPHIGYLDR